MRWLVQDEGSYDRCTVVEAECRPGKGHPLTVCWVPSLADELTEPTAADRAEMLARAELLARSEDMLQLLRQLYRHVEDYRLFDLVTWKQAGELLAHLKEIPHA